MDIHNHTDHYTGGGGEMQLPAGRRRDEIASRFTLVTFWSRHCGKVLLSGARHSKNTGMDSKRYPTALVQSRVKRKISGPPHQAGRMFW